MKKLRGGKRSRQQCFLHSDISGRREEGKATKITLIVRERKERGGNRKGQRDAEIIEMKKQF